MDSSPAAAPSVRFDEGSTLDARILRVIDDWSAGVSDDFDFNALALDIFRHQVEYNVPYARYCASLGVTLGELPQSWQEIPAVPARAFKEAALCTFDPSQAQLSFETSGTTLGTGGRHYMQNSRLYDAALLAGFKSAMLSDTTGPLRYLLLVPNPAEKPRSSLGYMMRAVAHHFGDGCERWYLRDDELLVDAFVEGVHASQSGCAVCVCATAFALVQLLDALNERGIARLPLPAGSRIMETGGFKGRTRTVRRSELYARLQSVFALPADRIVAEYGMTELTSQYYDATFEQVRVKRAPPWLRSRVVGPDRRRLPAGAVGALAHVDLGNRSSCISILTEDLGIATEDGGIILIGREHGAELRGCSLDAEELRALADG